MRMSPRTRVAGWGAAALVAAMLLVVGAVMLQGLSPQRAWADENQELKPEELGVVDFESLIRSHKDFEKLQQMDEQISLLKQELEFLPAEDRRRETDKARKKMESEVLKARKELEAEYNRINSEMRGLSAAMAGQLEAEGRQLQAHYQAQLEGEIRRLQPTQIELRGDAESKMKAFLQDLAVVREQRLTARRLELEKSTQARLEAERARVDAEVSAYEQGLMQENQQRKLNLQLQMQTVTDPEEEARIQEELAALGDEEAAKKEARRDELFASLDAMREKEKAAMDAELGSYQRSLDAEVQQKVQGERARLAGLPTQAPAAPPDIQAKIEAIKAQINGEMAARKAQMQATMEARSNEARTRLQKKQKEIEKRLSDLSKQLKEMVDQSTDDVSDDTKKKMDTVKAKLEEFQAQRKELYEKMVADLSTLVGEVAKKQNVPSVIGKFVVNLHCKDLTDLSMVAVKQAVR